MDTLLGEVEKLKGMGVNVGMFNNGDAARPHVVRFALDTDFLNKYTARQWGIVPKKPIVVQVCTSISKHKKKENIGF